MSKPQKKTKPVELQARNAAPEKPRKGPEPERVKIEGSFTGAIDAALKKKRPAAGWPK